MSNEVVIPPASWADAGTQDQTPEQVQMIASGQHRITDPNVTRRLAVQLQDAHERILANIDRHRDLEAQLRRERDEARGDAKEWKEYWSMATAYSRAQRDIAEGLRRERDAQLEQIRGYEALAALDPLPAPPTAAQPAQEQKGEQ